MLLVQGTRDGKPAALSKEILVNVLYNYLWKFVRAPEMGTPKQMQISHFISKIRVFAKCFYKCF